MRALLALLLASSAAAAEEIRIELFRGRPSARVEGELFDAAGARFERAVHRVEARGGTLLVDGQAVSPPVAASAPHVDGRELPGRVEAFADAGGLVVVNAVDLEDYVASVVAAEVPSSWPEAALQAQAVAARTFAVAQKIAQGPAARAHLGASVLDQVYGGSPSAPAARAAARATSGEVLTFGAAPIAAYFSASCGGKSESAEDAFHLDAGTTPYLVSRGDEGDADRPWTVRRSFADLSAALRKAGRLLAPVTGLAVASRTPSGRAKSLRLDTGAGPRTLPAVELRQILGYSALPSLLFEVRVEGGRAVFRGRGSGHGVGLCQWGARSRALRGEGYRGILAAYYPGAEIRRMY